MRHPASTLPTSEYTHSFWHSEPNDFLLSHHTTPELPPTADIIIVGSGITGTSAARYLAEDKRADGKSIVLLEAREACWGATGRNGGHCQPLLFDRGVNVAAFEISNVKAVRQYIDTHNVPCEWRTVAGCRTLWTEALMKKAEKDIDQLRKHAPKIAEVVSIIRDKEDLKKHRVSPDCVGATLTVGAGSLWPYKLVTFVLEKLIKEGRLNLQTNTPVTKITSSQSEHTLYTPRGKISARKVILATNGYTSAIAPQFADLIVPVRGQMSALLPPKGSTILPDSYGMVGALGQPEHNDDYLIQRPFGNVPNPAGHLGFGGGRGAGRLQTVGVSDDSIIDEGTATYLRGALLKVLELGGETKGVKELQATHQWTGIMGYSRDNYPWVGKVPDKEGLYIAGGYTGHGMPNGTLCGKAVVDFLLGEEAGEDFTTLQQKMVKDGDIPESYLITPERIATARSCPTVAAREGEGHFMPPLV
ncbi:FAD dependent oxidoreductase [Dendryphion nanum]|uniref:FAD dependent oxidoreductase n=1 Tax=Dendryphion nanum TaxID=256645 RepID=A0A9P9DAS2_9PLEO|nr:FAD dependent oxidoreductase [Dendryphion nanum]